MKHQDFNPCLASAFQRNQHIPVILMLVMPWRSWGALKMEVSSVSRTRQCGLVKYRSTCGDRCPRFKPWLSFLLIVTFNVCYQPNRNITCLPYLEMPSSGSDKIRFEKALWVSHKVTYRLISSTVKHEFGLMSSLAFLVSIRSVLKFCEIVKLQEVYCISCLCVSHSVVSDSLRPHRL